jgi:hypothetical protein
LVTRVRIPAARPGPLRKRGIVLEVPDYVPADWPGIYNPPLVRLDDLVPAERPLVLISGRSAGKRLQRVSYPPHLTPGGSP